MRDIAVLCGVAFALASFLALWALVAARRKAEGE